MSNQIEGYYTKGQKIVVIEDLISTGKSSLQVVDVLKKEGLIVEGMVSIFTYGFTQSTNAFSDAGLEYKSLTNYSTLIKLALEKGIIPGGIEELLLNWSANPAQWTGI